MFFKKLQLSKIYYWRKMPPPKSQNIATYCKVIASWLFSRSLGYYFLYTWETSAGRSWPSLACGANRMRASSAGWASFTLRYVAALEDKKCWLSFLIMEEIVGKSWWWRKVLRKQERCWSKSPRNLHFQHLR